MNDCAPCFISASLPMLTTFYEFSPFRTPPFLVILEVSLTTNAITLFLIGSTTIQPSLQIVELNLLASTKTSSQCYHISLFHGTSQHITLLPSTYNGHVVFDALQLSLIIILKELSCTFLQNYAYVHSSPYSWCFSIPCLSLRLSIWLMLHCFSLSFLLFKTANYWIRSS